MPCPSCGALRGHLLGCADDDPRFALPPPAEAVPAPEGEAGEELFEWRVRLIALPVALGLAALSHLTGPGAFVMRLCVGMPLHEVGHAIAAWFTGHLAFPLPWVTSMSARGYSATVLLAGGFGYLAFRLYQQQRLVLCAAAALAALAAVVGRLLPDSAASTLVTFAGDAGGMALGTLGMLAVFSRPGSRLHHGAIRWGLLFIGSGAFVDLLSTWVAARRDFAEIPFGTQEYAGLSDASRLVELAGWSESQLISRFLTVGFVCLASLVVVWALAVRSQHRRRASLGGAGGPA
ncbi:MAG: hypothetical protein ACYC8T_21970 [Myxococcaceae bacterium]